MISRIESLPLRNNGKKVYGQFLENDPEWRHTTSLTFKRFLDSEETSHPTVILKKLSRFLQQKVLVVSTRTNVKWKSDLCTITPYLKINRWVSTYAMIHTNLT